MLTNFDLWLLDCLEKFAQKTQRNIGIDCFLWARISIILFAFFIACNAFFVQYYSYPLKEWWISSLLLVFLSVAPIMWSTISPTEQRAKELSLRGLSNPCKLWSDCRLLYIFGAFLISLPCLVLSNTATERTAVFVWLGILGSCMFPLWLYFVSCDPLPPAKSRVREWLESTVKSAKEFLAPAVEPDPATAPP